MADNSTDNETVIDDRNYVHTGIATIASATPIEQQILAELREHTRLLNEFVAAINQVGDMFSGGEGGKPISPMSMITGALFKR